MAHRGHAAILIVAAILNTVAMLKVVAILNCFMQHIRKS